MDSYHDHSSILKDNRQYYTLNNSINIQASTYLENQRCSIGRKQLPVIFEEGKSNLVNTHYQLPTVNNYTFTSNQGVSNSNNNLGNNQSANNQLTHNRQAVNDLVEYKAYHPAQPGNIHQPQASNNLAACQAIYQSSTPKVPLQNNTSVAPQIKSNQINCSQHIIVNQPPGGNQVIQLARENETKQSFISNQVLYNTRDSHTTRPASRNQIVDHSSYPQNSSQFNQPVQANQTVNRNQISGRNTPPNSTIQPQRTMNVNVDSRYTHPGGYPAQLQQIPASSPSPQGYTPQLRSYPQTSNVQNNVYGQRNDTEHVLDSIANQQNFNQGQMYQKVNHPTNYLPEQVRGSQIPNYPPDQVSPNASEVSYYPFHRDLLNATAESDLQQNYSVKLPSGAVHQYPLPDYVDNSGSYCDMPQNYPLRHNAPMNGGTAYNVDNNPYFSAPRNVAKGSPNQISLVSHPGQQPQQQQPQQGSQQQQQQRQLQQQQQPQQTSPHLKHQIKLQQQQLPPQQQQQQTQQQKQQSQQQQQQLHQQQQQVAQQIPQHVQQQQQTQVHRDDGQQQQQQQQRQQQLQQQQQQQQQQQHQKQQQQQFQQCQQQKQQVQQQQLYNVQTSSADVLPNQYSQMLSQLAAKQESEQKYLAEPESQFQSNGEQDFTVYRSTSQESPQGSPMPNQQTSPGVFKTPQATPPLPRKQTPVRQISNEMYKLDSPSNALLLQDMSLNSPRPRSETFEMEPPSLPPRSPQLKQSEPYVDLTQTSYSPVSSPQMVHPTASASYGPQQQQADEVVQQTRQSTQCAEIPHVEVYNVSQQNPDVNPRLRSGTVEMIDSPPLINPKQDAQQSAKQMMPPPNTTSVYRYVMYANSSGNSNLNSPMQRSRAGTVEMADTSQACVSYDDNPPSSSNEQRIRSGTVEMTDTPPTPHRQLPVQQQPPPVQQVQSLDQTVQHQQAVQQQQQPLQQPIQQQEPQQSQQQQLQQQQQQQLQQPYQVKVNVPLSIKNDNFYSSAPQTYDERAGVNKPPPPYPNYVIKSSVSEQTPTVVDNKPVLVNSSCQAILSHPPSTVNSYSIQSHQSVQVNYQNSKQDLYPTQVPSSCKSNSLEHTTVKSESEIQSPCLSINSTSKVPQQPPTGSNIQQPKVASDLPSRKTDIVSNNYNQYPLPPTTASQYIYDESNKYPNVKQVSPNSQNNMNQLSDQELERQQKIMQQQYVQRVRQVQLQQQLRELQSEYEANLFIEQDIAQEFLREQRELSNGSSQHTQYQQTASMPRNHGQCMTPQVNTPYSPPGQQMMPPPRVPYNNKDGGVFPVTGLPISQQVYHQRLPTPQRPGQNQPIVILPGGGSFSNPGQYNPLLTTPVKKETGTPAPSNSNTSSKPQTPFQKLRKIAEDISSFVDDVVKFKGKKGDQEYKCLEEMLTQQLLLLDKVAANSNDELRSARKALVKEVQELLEILEKRATSTATS